MAVGLSRCSCGLLLATSKALSAQAMLFESRDVASARLSPGAKYSGKFCNPETLNPKPPFLLSSNLSRMMTARLAHGASATGEVAGTVAAVRPVSDAISNYLDGGTPNVSQAPSAARSLGHRVPALAVSILEAMDKMFVGPLTPILAVSCLIVVQSAIEQLLYMPGAFAPRRQSDLSTCQGSEA